mmetsp:Transcript_73158/g.118697  ORF Transcript_73158/g.118697 Transcript_73158/m.118697 type:complete len:1450 (+) Transcript_73158:210-4559(+)|eukprot:CAMPEP_0179413184 /NCGR_PEP_ID=MMETSP0799-20121207/4945_1 /TAXON_ID=46947 /ORGANISM="Geminigera cryophila, Strain CCMP2564" /LENGTH=1449 /DNA_ID=CAMNT_0021185603 /DNA_START=205 /DNA_END=4554 /DNA_ORIENTATION=-
MPPKSATEWAKGFNNVGTPKKITYLKTFLELKQADRPKLNNTAAKKLLDFVVDEAKQETQESVNMENGGGSFRLGLNVIYDCVVPDVEGSDDGSEGCGVIVESIESNKNTLLQANFGEYLSKVYKNAMQRLDENSDTNAFGIAKNMDSLLKMLSSIIEDCKNDQVNMNLLLVEEKMLDTLIEDWCFPQGSNEASQVSVQWKKQPLDMQYYALECLCSFLLEQQNVQAFAVGKKDCSSRITAILNLAASARSGAISERCFKLLAQLASKLDANFRKLNLENPVEAALKDWLTAPPDAFRTKSISKAAADKIVKSFKKIYMIDDSDEVLSLKNLSQHDSLLAVYTSMIKQGRGYLETIEVQSLKISDHKDADTWHVVYGKMELTAESVSMLISTEGGQPDVEDTSIMHIPLDTISCMKVTETNGQNDLSVEIEFDDNHPFVCPVFDEPLKSISLTFGKSSGPAEFAGLVPNLAEEEEDEEVPIQHSQTSNTMSATSRSRCDVAMMNKHGDDPRETHASKSFYAGTSQANEEEEEPSAQKVDSAKKYKTRGRPRGRQAISTVLDDDATSVDEDENQKAAELEAAAKAAEKEKLKIEKEQQKKDKKIQDEKTKQEKLRVKKEQAEAEEQAAAAALEEEVQAKKAKELAEKKIKKDRDNEKRLKEEHLRKEKKEKEQKEKENAKRLQEEHVKKMAKEKEENDKKAAEKLESEEREAREAEEAKQEREAEEAKEKEKMQEKADKAKKDKAAKEEKEAARKKKIEDEKEAKEKIKDDKARKELKEKEEKAKKELKEKEREHQKKQERAANSSKSKDTKDAKTSVTEKKRGRPAKTDKMAHEADAMEEDEVPETQQEEEKPTGSNRRPSARGGRFATEVDAEQEPTVLSQALPSLRGRKKSTAEAKAADLPVDPFACDTSDAEVKAPSKRPSEEKRKDTAKKAKSDYTKKLASQEKTGENHGERVSTLSVEAVKKVGHLSNRTDEWATESAKHVAATKEAKMPQAPVKTSKAHSSEDAGHSIQKMEIEQRPLAKSLSKKNCRLEFEVAKKPEGKDVMDEDGEKDGETEPSTEKESIGTGKESKVKAAVAGELKKDDDDPYAENYTLEEKQESQEDKYKCNEDEVRQSSRKAKDVPGKAPASGCKSAAASGKMRKSDGSETRLLDDSVISGITTVEKPVDALGEGAAIASNPVGKHQRDQAIHETEFNASPEEDTQDDSLSSTSGTFGCRVNPTVIDFSASEMPENIAPVGTAGKVAVDDDSDFELDDAQESMSNPYEDVFDCSASGGRGAPSQRTSRIATQLKNLVKNMSQAKRDNLKKHTMEEKSKIAAKVQAFSEKKAKEILAQDKAFDKKHKELNDTLKEVAIKMNSAYAVFKRSAIDIHKEGRTLKQQIASFESKKILRKTTLKDFVQEATKTCRNTCSAHIKELEKKVQQSKTAKNGEMNEIHKLLGQLFAD